MDFLFEVNSVVLGLLVTVLYLLTIAQTLHVVFLASSKDIKRVWMIIGYETLLLVHLILSTTLVQSALQNNGDLIMGLWFVHLPLEMLLWANAFPLALGIALCFMLRNPTMIAELVVLLAFTPPIIKLIGEFWWVVPVLDASFFLFRLIVKIRSDIRCRSVSVSRFSTVEAVNVLPEGVLCADGRGRVVLMNDSMRSCLAELEFPADLGDTRGLWAALQDKAALGPAPDALLPEGVQLRISDKKIRLFTVDKTVLRGTPCQRIMAIDITEEEHFNLRIEQTNRLLEETGDKMQRSMNGLQAAVENEVLLRMRSHVHDTVGQRLSILHRYLEDGDTSTESLEKIRLLLDTALDDLAVREAPNHEADLVAIADAFSLAGVDLAVSGALPADDAIAGVFVRVVREAATNAARHAQASLVSVAIEQSEKNSELFVTNDGTPFEGPMREGSGMSGLRQAAHEVGGTLNWHSGPPFALHVLVPREGETS